jgi:hypothetical protein
MVNTEGKKKFQLEQEEGTIVGQENLKKNISEYYKTLFGPPIPNTCEMIESTTQDIRQVLGEENDFLTKDFTEKEIFEAIVQMEKKTNRPGQMASRRSFIKVFGKS